MRCIIDITSFYDINISKILTGKDVLNLLKYLLKNFTHFDIIDAIIILLGNLAGNEHTISSNIISHNIFSNIMELILKEYDNINNKKNIPKYLHSLSFLLINLIKINNSNKVLNDDLVIYLLI